MDKKEEEQTQINMTAIYSNLRKFHLEETYCDVNFLVENRPFRSNRLLLAALSDYFNTMFFGSGDTKYKESVTGEKTPIVLRDINAASFKQILDFVSTGNVDLTGCTCHSLFALLRTCDFLRLRIPFVEDQCVLKLTSTVQEAKDPIMIGFEMFTFVCTTNRKTLIDVLSEHIFKYLNHFSNDDNFMELEYSDLVTLLKFKNVSRKNENRLLNTVIRWIHYDRKKRRIHYNELMENIDFSNISARYVAFMSSEYENMIDRLTSDEDDVSATDTCFVDCPDNDGNLKIFTAVPVPQFNAGGGSFSNLPLATTSTNSTNSSNSALNSLSFTFPTPARI